MHQLLPSIDHLNCMMVQSLSFKFMKDPVCIYRQMLTMLYIRKGKWFKSPIRSPQNPCWRLLMGDLHTDRAFIRVKTKKPKMNFCVSGMTNRWRVSGVVINIKVFTMRVNLIKFLFHVDFFIEIAIHLPPSLSILMLPLTVLIPKANVSERKQFFLLFFFFLYLITFSFTVWYPQRFFFLIIFEFF